MVIDMTSSAANDDLPSAIQELGFDPLSPHYAWNGPPPQMQPAPDGTVDDLKTRRLPAFLVVVSTEAERKAVFLVARPLRGTGGKLLTVGPYDDDSNVYYLALLGRCPVVIVESEGGSIGRAASSLVVYDAVLRWKPQYVISIGICFGRRSDGPWPRLGDVVVSHDVLPYERKRLGPHNTVERGKVMNGVEFLVNLFSQQRGAELPNKLGERTARKGRILSGEKLVDNRKFRDTLFREYSPDQVVAGEMEAAGSAAACERAQIGWVVVKAIADWGDGDKKPGRFDLVQSFAAYSAAMVVKRGLEADSTRKWWIFSESRPVMNLTARLSVPRDRVIIQSHPKELRLWHPKNFPIVAKMSRVSTTALSLLTFLDDVCVVTGDLPDSDLESIMIIQDWFLHGFGQRRVVRDESIAPPQLDPKRDRRLLDGNVFSIGGPVDCRLSRYGMGYAFNGETFASSALPRMFDLVRSRRHGTVLWTWQGNEEEEFAWRIVDRQGRRVHMGLPDRLGRIREDVVVVAVVPNRATEGARRTNRKHLIVAAAHTLGQLGFVDALQSDELWREIERRSARKPFWQAVIGITGEWRSSLGHYEPVASAVNEVRVLPPSLFMTRPLLRQWFQRGSR